MKSKTSIFFLLSIILLINGNFYSASGQNLELLHDFSIKLSIAPSQVESGVSSHPIGFVYVLNSNGVAITSSDDVKIQLVSDNPEIASVPEHVILKANQEYAQFDIQTGILKGETTVTAMFDDKTSFDTIRVGGDKNHLPDDLFLELLLPTKNMHVNSQMPFSVFLKTSGDQVVRAPYDIDIDIENENTMASIDSKKLTIKQGSYYAWGIIETNNKVGNTFLRATNDDTGLDTAKSIRISSTLPSSIQVHTFPKLLPAEFDRELDIFVSLLDSSGNPTKAHKDIPIEFFSNIKNPLGETLDETSRSEKPMIKQGEFGYHLKQKFNLHNLLKNEIIIGASSEGYGTDTDTFRTVGKSLEMTDTIKRTLNNKLDFGWDVKDYDTTVQLFGLPAIPSNSTAIVSYQLSIIEDDEDDDGIAPDGSEVEIHPDCLDSESELFESSDTVEHNMELDIEERILFTIDCMNDEDLYPLLSSEHQYADGYVKRINVNSGNGDLAIVSEPGNIKKATSFGTAVISTGQKSGSVEISTSVNGIGTGSFSTSVVNSLEFNKVILFSPVGEDVILFDRNGNFDIFLVALDPSNRPKILDEDSKFLITPTNGLVDLKKGTTFSFVKLRSDSFAVGKDEPINLITTPIGEDVDSRLESSKTFSTQPTSKMKIYFPIDSMNVKHVGDFGIVQIVDMQGNPIIPNSDIKTKIVSSDTSVAKTNNDVIIPQGLSYTTFPIETPGSVGTSTITASAKGVIPMKSDFNTSTSDVKLKIFTGGFEEKIPANEPFEIKLYVDDENAETIEGAMVKINSDGNVTITPDSVRTGADGSASFSVTAEKGPEISLDIIATAEGYVDGQESLIIDIDEPEPTMSPIDVDLPEWILFVVIFALVLVGILVALFLKKSKEDMDEVWEEEEI